jgi:hypothetical protein
MASSRLIDYYSGMPEDSVLVSVESPHTEWESRVLKVVHSRWPTSSLEIAEFLGHSVTTRDEKRLLSSRIVYHIKKLVERKRLMSKRFGHALVVWPYEVETLRVMHEMMKPVKKEGKD